MASKRLDPSHVDNNPSAQDDETKDSATTPELLKMAVVITFWSALVVCLVSLAAGFLLGTTPFSRTDPGQPLYLSTYIEQGLYQEAQRLSRTGHLPGTSGEEYSGFITVNKQYNSNIFFWFIPAKNIDPAHAPVLVFLEGGPGTTSLFALFAHIGPYSVDKDLKLVPRYVDWSRNYSVVYVDQPVGTGFSFTDDDAGYARSEDDVARDLYSFLTQFYTMFYQYQQNDLYLAGESYGGKFVPALGHKIHTENPAATRKMNLKGLIIGVGFIDPETLIPSLGDYLYNVGMMNRKEKEDYDSQIAVIVSLIQSSNTTGAMNLYRNLMYGPGLVAKATGFLLRLNILSDGIGPNLLAFGQYVDQPSVRHALHVGNTVFNTSSQVVGAYLAGDFLDTVKPWFITLVEKYKVLLYIGQLDMSVTVPGTEKFLWDLQWSGQQQYRTADKVIWKLTPSDTEVAGYVTTVGNFTQATIRGAGHMTAFDQPERVYDLLRSFIENLPLSR